MRTAAVIRPPAPASSPSCTWPATLATSGRCTLPVLWDTRTQRIVSNDAAQLTVQMETEFVAFHRPGAPDLYPVSMRRDIDALAMLMLHTVNNGVYKAGLATTQAAYEEAFDALFTTLDALEERLGRRRFLLGGQVTEADVRLFPTLARFDAVYYLHYKCNLHRLADYPHLWGYARDLYRGRGSATPRTSFRSSGITTRPSPGSTRPGSCPRARS